MVGPYSAKAVANALLQRSFNKKQTVTHLKLQKLVFLAHGYYLGMSKRPLINENFETWDYGPVCRGIYQEFRDTGGEPINRLATELDWDSGAEIPVPVPEDDKRFDRIADFVVQTYGDVSAFALCELSHKEGWAWDQTRKEDTFGLKNKDIPNDLIERDFAPFLKKKSS